MFWGPPELPVFSRCHLLIDGGDDTHLGPASQNCVASVTVSLSSIRNKTALCTLGEHNHQGQPGTVATRKMLGS